MKKICISFVLVFLFVGSLFSQSNDPIQFVKEIDTGKQYMVFLDSNIDDPHIYRKLTIFLNSVNEGDEVIFKLLTYGGVAQSGIYIYNSIINCKAKTIADVHYAMSAGAIISVACEEIRINKHAVILFHGVQIGGFIGGSLAKITKEMADQLEWYNSVIEEISEGFLTPEEIKKVLEGEDVTIYEKELLKRIKTWKPINVKKRDYKKLKEEYRRKKLKGEVALSIESEEDKLQKLFDALDKELQNK